MWRSSNGKQRSIALASVFQVSLQVFYQDQSPEIYALAAWRERHALQSWHLILKRMGSLLQPLACAYAGENRLWWQSDL